MDSIVPPLRHDGEPGDSLPGRLLAALRAGAKPLSDQALSGAIQFARITLIAGLVFLHYGEFFNSAATPRMGLDPVEHPLATFVNGQLRSTSATWPLRSMEMNGSSSR